MSGVAVALLLLVGHLGVRVAADYGVETSGPVEQLEDGEETTSPTSFQGDDYTKVARDGTLLVCDEEVDDNLVKAVYEFERDGDRDRAEVADERGADGTCAGIEPSDPVVGHMVCERNHLIWHCGNWQAA